MATNDCQRTWKQRNPEKVRAQRKRYVEKHPDVIARYREKNKEKILARAGERRKERKGFLADYKRDCGCRICAENEPCCLDFHHINGKEKDFTLATLRSYSEETMMKEINKCAILCSNCHRKLHAGLIKLEE